MDYVAVDLGASSTRYTTISKKIGFIPNNMFFVSNMAEKLDNARSGEIIENNLDVSIWKDGDSKFFPMRALVGQMAFRYNPINRTPEQSKPKYLQPINYFSTILAVALSKLKTPELGDKINLFSVLPPTEAEAHKAEFRANLIGKYTVSFNKINTTMQFEINDVFCYEESRMALTQFLFDNVEENRYEKYKGSTLMSLDIGASTIDLAIFENAEYIERTGRTYKVGGNTVRDLISKAIIAKYGTELPIKDVEQCLIEGRIKKGNTYENIGDIVENCKRQVANQIVTNMDSYFTSINMNLMSVNCIIVSGGGSMQSSYVNDTGDVVVTSKPMSHYITESLKEICDTVDVVHIGDEPRTANIRGLGLYAAICDGEPDM